MRSSFDRIYYSIVQHVLMTIYNPAAMRVMHIILSDMRFTKRTEGSQCEIPGTDVHEINITLF